MEDKQKNLSAFDRELLALYLAVQHFEHIIEGRDITFITDHRGLLSIFNRRQPHKLRRRSDQIEYLSQFTNKIVPISGASNIIADGLSRLEEHEKVAELQAEITIQRIVEEQAVDNEVQNIFANGHRKMNIKMVIIDETPAICIVTDTKTRVIVPKILRRPLFLQLHSLSHPGSRASTRLIQKKFYWPKMQSDIKLWVRTCHECQRTKVHRHTKSEIDSFPPSDRFRHVHTDIVGPLYSVKGYRYVCTFIDRETKWIEATPVRDIAVSYTHLTLPTIYSV